MNDYELTPSSNEAIEQGCKCPRWENRVVDVGPKQTSVDCPIHGDTNE